MLQSMAVLIYLGSYPSYTEYFPRKSEPDDGELQTQSH